VTPDYFAMLGISLVRGRVFTDQDRDGAPPVVVVNEAAARRLWGTADPLGKRLTIGRPGVAAPWLTVVGVVRSTVASPLGRGPSPLLYTPFLQQPNRPATLLVRAAPGVDVNALAPAVRAAVSAVDPDLPVDDVQTMDRALSAWIWPVRFFARLLGALAALALALAATGVSAVMAYAVAQRTREIGIRVALGADPARVLRLVLGYGASLTGVGVALGLLGALALTGVLRQVLFGTDPRDPLVLATVAVVLAAVALLACWLPTRRALSIEPMVALRQE
jgi:putative ABC transport system permease protein